MVDYLSPFAKEFPALPAISGVKMSSLNSGIKYPVRDDLLLVTLAEGTTVGGVFTTNRMCGAPIDWCKSILSKGTARALAVNAGIANVFTGAAGARTCKNTAAAIAEMLGCDIQEIYVASTGVIGQILDENKIINKLPLLSGSLCEDGWKKSAEAIMTTDTFPKGVTKTVSIGGTNVTLNGIIKGSGMIAPNMATMLGYIFTDAAIPSAVLQAMLDEDKDYTYNCMTVDSDTSTSDMIVAFATGQASHPAIHTKDDEIFAEFRQAFREINTELAKWVAKDGEGITKFITVHVKGATSHKAARTIGLSIANSPLVKTAISGGDPNWGRITMGIGKAGEEVNRDKTSIWVGDILIAENGAQHPDYKEVDAVAYMKGGNIDITVDVGVGEAEATVWTSDLTHEYIRINVDYRS